MNPAHDPFEMHRLALSLAEAQHHEDTDQVTAILAAVAEPDIGAFLTAIAEMVFHAHGADPKPGFPAFIADYRAQLNAAALAYEHGQAGGEPEE